MMCWFWSDWWGWGWWGMILDMMLMMVLWGVFIVLVTWAIVKIVRSGQQPSSQTPLDIAKARYARGEINKEEFERLKKDLS